MALRLHLPTARRGYPQVRRLEKRLGWGISVNGPLVRKKRAAS